jgi:eukaryotic-like serine/threonine-protein kinase
MPVTAGTRFGPYEIVDLLGAGGMGEVYRARDTRLERTVALKLLPEALATDAGARARFEREAKAISALNHPHICALHDVGRHGGADFLVLELLEGETLAARLQRGPLPFSHVLKLGAEIADALGAAHRQGIVHRDLKPANVMLTATGVKLLDFGLAKPAPQQLGALVTGAHTADLTARGTIVGTLQYMAPEQLQGLDADARTDIFALGAILHEMCTGRRAFEGRGHASLIAKILETDPPAVSSLVALAPPAFDQLVQRCLEKDPGDRWQSARDLALQLRGMQAQVSGSVTGALAPARTRRARPWLPWAVAALCAATAAGAVLLPRSTVTIDAPALRFDVTLPAHMRMGVADGPAISPDGRWAIYRAATDGQPQLFRADLSTQETMPLAGTEGGVGPFWSPDSRSIAFFAASSLKHVSVTGGPVRPLAAAPQPGGGAWGHGIILFSSEGVIHRVPEAGGTPEALPLPAGGRYGWPQLLPDNKSFVVVEVGRQVLLGASLDKAGDPKVIEDGITGLTGVRFEAGHLVLRRAQTLGARAFDVSRLEPTGPFQVLAESAFSFSVSRSGIVAFRSAAVRPRQLTWFTRDGARAGTVGEPGQVLGLSMGPSDRRAAIWRTAGTNVDLWSVDLSSTITSRLTSDAAMDSDAAWSPDGRLLAFSSNRTGRFAVYLKHLVDGREELLAQMDRPFVVDTWTPDGAHVVARTTGGAVYLVPVSGDRTPKMLVDTPYIEDELQISPDGRWVAFNADESGRWEIYVAAFPSFTARQQVSAGGGVQPQWRADGRELFFLSLEGSMMSVQLTQGLELTAAAPRQLFTTNIDPDPHHRQYAPTRDGQRFLGLDAGEHRRHTFTYLLNVLGPPAQAR